MIRALACYSGQARRLPSLNSNQREILIQQAGTKSSLNARAIVAIIRQKTAPELESKRRERDMSDAPNAPNEPQPAPRRKEFEDPHYHDDDELPGEDEQHRDRPPGGPRKPPRRILP